MRAYITGFCLSLGLTLVAYLLVVDNSLPRTQLLAAITALALVQLTVQLVYFLHLGREAKPRWNLMAFMFMLLVLVIVVFGSLWIMHNLDYRHMTPSQTDRYLLDEENLSPELD